MSVTGIVAALKAEARTLAPLPPGRLLAISGMGPQAAAHAAEALIGAGAEAVLSFGLAGALDPSWRAGTVVVPHSIVDGAGGEHLAYGPWRERLAAQAAGVADARGVAGGTLLSVARPLATIESKSQARSHSGAGAVDMESFAIAEVAARMGVRFAVVRVVIDGAGDALPLSAMRATGAYGEVSLPRLLAGLARAPKELPMLMQWPQRYRAALRALRGLGQLDLGLP